MVIKLVTNALMDKAHKHPEIIWTVALILCLLGASCTLASTVGGAGAGAGLGSLVSPEVAILSAAAGAALGYAAAPPDESLTIPDGTPLTVINESPDSAWGLLGKIVEVAPGLLLAFALVWIISLFAPPPTRWFKRKEKKS